MGGGCISPVNRRCLFHKEPRSAFPSARPIAFRFQFSLRACAIVSPAATKFRIGTASWADPGLKEDL